MTQYLALVEPLVQPLPRHPHYMLLPIDEGFTWDECFANVDLGNWYLVAFRSKHRADADEELLTALDNAASEAARELKGFLYYFIGTPLQSGECLSFCLWQTREEAALASAQPAHREAVLRGVQHYEYYTLERYSIIKQDGELTFTRL
jgi:heme-degrading monooxygenase HmoA